MSVEAYMRNILNGQRPNNYEIMAEEAAKSFSQMDMQEISRRTGIAPVDGAFRLVFLGREYSVSAEDGTVACSSGEPAGIDISMIMYDLLGYCEKDARPSGEYTQVQNLASVLSATKYAGQGMHERQAKQFDGKDEQLRRACEALGGTPLGKGDVSYCIPLYRDLSFMFSFWNSDDEFPASANILFDKNSLQYMHYETLWYCLGLIFSRISQEMPKS